MRSDSVCRLVELGAGPFKLPDVRLVDSVGCRGKNLAGVEALDIAVEISGCGSFASPTTLYACIEGQQRPRSRPS